MPLGLGFLFSLIPNDLRVLADQKWPSDHTRLIKVAKADIIDSDREAFTMQSITRHQASYAYWH